MLKNSINRNIVECKEVCGKKRAANMGVLIETLWNVKKDTSLGASADESINRNIVECKAQPCNMYAHLLSSINRNIVECKEYTKREQQELLEVLIETLWNVKWFINSNVVI